MIPDFTVAGVLPPFVGSSSSEIRGVSPYETTMLELARRFCTSAERADLFTGFLRLRKELTSLGLTQGVQWINGSFCEDVEMTRGRPPADVDLVTLLARPPSLQDPKTWKTVVNANKKIFSPTESRKEFGCEAYYIEFGAVPALMVTRQITYWFGLFTHQRVTHLWKGVLQVPLVSDDEDASKFVDSLGFAS